MSDREVQYAVQETAASTKRILDILSRELGDDKDRKRQLELLNEIKSGLVVIAWLLAAVLAAAGLGLFQ